jgi:hypothetical protein
MVRAVLGILVVLAHRFLLSVLYLIISVLSVAIRRRIAMVMEQFRKG